MTILLGLSDATSAALLGAVVGGTIAVIGSWSVVYIQYLFKRSGHVLLKPYDYDAYFTCRRPNGDMQNIHPNDPEALTDLQDNIVAGEYTFRLHIYNDTDVPVAIEVAQCEFHHKESHFHDEPQLISYQLGLYVCQTTVSKMALMFPRTNS